MPRVASGLCAFGEAIADVKHTYLASYTAVMTRLDPARLNALFLELEARGHSDLREEGFGTADIVVERSLDMKYVDQVHECNVSIARFEVTAERLGEIEDAFHRRHEALYTYCERDNTPELINVEVNVYGRSPAPRPPGPPAGRAAPPCRASSAVPTSRSSAPTGRRRCTGARRCERGTPSMAPRSSRRRRQRSSCSPARACASRPTTSSS